jgi:hypothetical protein
MQNIGKRIKSVLLTVGASLVLGLLSFAGFYAIFPYVPFAITSFFLATIYEAQIFDQNITDVLNKLSAKDYFKQLRSNRLLDALNEKFGTALQEKHSFFKEYEELQEYIHKLEHRKQHDKTQKAALKTSRKRLVLLQRYFMQTIFDPQEENTLEAKALREFLNTLEKDETFPDIDCPDNLMLEAQQKEKLLRLGKYFSRISGLFIAVGTAALLFESIPMISFITLSAAAMPYVVIPLAIFAGLSYYYLTCNSTFDMITDDTMQKWYREVKESVKKSSIGKSIALIISSLLVLGMGVSLSVFVGGSWWTAVKQSPQLRQALGKSVHLITAVFTAFFGFLAQLVFAVVNIKETWDNFLGLFSGIKAKNFLGALLEVSTQLFITPFKVLGLRIQHAFHHESAYQFFNPFRLIVNVIETPLRIIGFLAHVSSVGATADRVPGIPNIIAAMLAALEELLEDAHYFTGHSAETHEENEEHCLHSDDEHAGHDHSSDIPTKLIKAALSPLYALSSAWHWSTSHLTKAPVTFKHALCKQWGIDDRKENIPVLLKAALSTLYFLPALWHWGNSKATDKPVTFKHALNKQWGIDETQEETPLPKAPTQLAYLTKATALIELKDKEITYKNTSKQALYTTCRGRVETLDAESLNQSSFDELLNEPVSFKGKQTTMKSAFSSNRYLHFHQKTTSEQFFDTFCEELPKRSTPT